MYIYNSPLIYVLVFAKLGGTEYPWVTALLADKLTITYKPSKSNVDAVSLSRLNEIQTLNENTRATIFPLTYE